MKPKKLLTLILICQSSQVLLGMKKRGFGVGRWNGFGGKALPKESIETAARRELQEEINLTVDKLESVGVIEFEFINNPEIHQVHIFKVTNYSGIPQESEEMKPQWFDLEKIPYSEMWPDDQFWLPLVLQGKKVKGRFLFDESDHILEQELKIV